MPKKTKKTRVIDPQGDWYGDVYVTVKLRLRVACKNFQAENATTMLNALADTDDVGIGDITDDETIEYLSVDEIDGNPVEDE